MGRTLGVFYGAFNLGVIAGGPLGGLIAGWTNLRGPLFAYAGLLFVAGAMYLKFVRDPAPVIEEVSEDAVAPEPGGWRSTIRETLGAAGKLLRRPALVTPLFLHFPYLVMVIALYHT